MLAVNDRVLDIALIAHTSELAAHADVFRALKPALPALKGLVNVAQATPPPPSGDAVTRGKEILRRGFQWHQEALRQLRGHVEKPETLSEELAPIIATMKVYTTELLADK